MTFCVGTCSLVLVGLGWSADGFTLEDAKKDADEEAECGRWWFVRTLDVLIGLDIEKKIDEAAKQAKGASK